MHSCFAKILGDCEGQIEDEHFIPDSIQKLLATVTISGLPWQSRSPKTIQPGTYAHSRIICKKHHNELDGLDGNALAYFRNWMLIMGKHYIGTGEVGKIEHITPSINGRGLERWFMKTICGALSSQNIVRSYKIPDQWIMGLFFRIQWPDEWAIWFANEENHEIKPIDAAINIDFIWAEDRHLRGINIIAFGVITFFSIDPPDFIPPNFIRRPRTLGARINRPDGSGSLDGMSAGQPIEFQLAW
jgi:hypothetical protein